MNEKYLKTKEGSIEDTVKQMQNKVLESDYQDKFKKALDKEGKPLGHMTGAEKKSFFNKVDKMHKGKNEKFEPHMMYDPKTGKGTKADTESDHLKMKKMGYSHDKPKDVKEDISETHTTQTAKANAHQRSAGGEKSPISHMVNKSIKEITANDGKTFAQMRAEMDEACWDSHKQVGTKMKGGKRVPNCVPKNEELEESAASDQAKSMGLTYLKFGRYGKNGKVTHKSDGGALRKFDPKTGKLGDKEKPKFKKMSVADVNVDDIKGNELKIPNVANPSELVRGLKDKYGDKYKVTNGPTSVTITKNQDATSLSSKEKEQEVQKLKDKIGLYKKDGSPSAGKLKGIITSKIRSQSGAGDDLGFIEYSYPSSDTLEMDADEPDELVKVLKKRFGDALDIKTDYNIVTAKVKDFDDIKENIDDYPDLKKYGYTDVLPASKLTPAQKKFQNLLKRLDKDRQAKKAAYLKNEKEEVQEADLTDKQVDMVKKVADKLPKDDFKKRYGKDADNVKFGTATNIVKKKLNIDGYDGARNLVDRLLKKEKGDE